jgi:hypothetical protein
MKARKVRNPPPRGYVRLRQTPNGAFLVTIPAALGRLVGTDRLFRVELVDEGILLRYVDGGEPLVSSLPAWLVEGG